jgi:threonine synthase
MIMNSPKLISTLTRIEYPFDRIEEFTDNGESLEVDLGPLTRVKIHKAKYLWERYSDFLPFKKMSPEYSLGEGNTSLVTSKPLSEYTGIDNLFLKNETQNPTWSFKDRGSLTTIFYIKELGEKYTATISTGNMGHSLSAYGARAGLKVIVFVPQYATDEKISSMAIHGTIIVKVNAPDYSMMKHRVLELAKEMQLRIISGNHALRVEGYKLTAFELYEQLQGNIPDFIAVPTSACGHIRGLFKGFKELKEAGYIKKLPRMIVVQAKNNSPIVQAIKRKKKHIIPFKKVNTIAGAISMGTPIGGDEIVLKAYQYDWLAENVTESEILDSQERFAKCGYFVEPASATVLETVRKLKNAGKIKKHHSVVLIITGSGLKDMHVLQHHKPNIINTDIRLLSRELPRILEEHLS